MEKSFKIIVIAIALITATETCIAVQNTSATAVVPKLRTKSAPSIQEYNINSEYPANSVVSYKGIQYKNGWWANPGDCPLKEDCPKNYKEGMWKKYDPTLKHEFANYDYPTLQANYPKLSVCTKSEYSINYVKKAIDASVVNGEMAKAVPSGGFTAQDKEALYSEYMLPCKPDLDLANKNSLPSNV